MSRILILNFILKFILIVTFVQIFSDKNVEDTGKTIQEIIASRGFEPETHYITTKDGYILQIIRIVNPNRRFRSHQLKPVLLFHGFQCSGSIWLVAANGSIGDDGNYYEHSADGQIILDNEGSVGNTLGFVLSNRGYDVWVANSRGNIYSTNHSTLDSNEEKYWQFSIDEIIQHDLPAVIDHIQSTTNHSTISYIGHSQGNFLMFGLLATQSQYSHVIKPFIAISPVVYTTEFNAILNWFKPFKSQIAWLFPRRFFTDMIKVVQMPNWCTNPIWKHTICYWAYYLACGSHRSEVDFNRLPVYLDNVFLGASTQNFVHILQLLNHGHPVHYDYENGGLNFAKYSQTNPLPYNMSAINSTDIALIYAQNDWFNSLKDVQMLKQSLNVTLLKDYEVEVKHWNHVELMWAKDSGKYVNSQVLRLLEEY